MPYKLTEGGQGAWTAWFGASSSLLLSPRVKMMTFAKKLVPIGADRTGALHARAPLPCLPAQLARPHSLTRMCTWGASAQKLLINTDAPPVRLLAGKLLCWAGVGARVKVSVTTHQSLFWYRLHSGRCPHET